MSEELALSAGSRLPRAHSGAEPQHLLITLLGDYWTGQKALIPSTALVELLAEFGASESSARQAMRRLAARGLLVHEKIGRATYYGVPPRITEATSTRLVRAMGFGSGFVEWDEKWTVVSFSVPERDRDVRRLLRNGLRTLKFGLLNDAIWISPHDRAVQAEGLLDRLGVESAAVMRAELLPRRGEAYSFGDVFELSTLATAYREFIERHEHTIEWARSGRMAASEALVLRTTLMSEWLSFRVEDPELPLSLLPEDWPREHARSVFIQIYDHLGETAEIRFRKIIAAVDPELARLATHHTSRDTTKVVG
ncbi:PaaX family transcriptional regulator [Homoserinimonas sp. A447]